MKLSDNIKYFMKLRGMKPADLARKSRIAQPRIHEIVNDITKNPRTETLGKIAVALNVSTDALVSENPEVYAADLSKMKIIQVFEGMTPEEAEALRIMRECPEALAVVRMMGAVDNDTQKDIQRIAETEKRTFEKLRQLQELKKA